MSESIYGSLKVSQGSHRGITPEGPTRDPEAGWPHSKARGGEPYQELNGVEPTPRVARGVPKNFEVNRSKTLGVDVSQYH